MSTGTATANIAPPSGTGNRKAVLINDLATSAAKLDEDDIPQEGRWMAMPSKMYHNMLIENKAELLHMAIGISGEAGELLDAVKKHCIYNQPMDFKNITEELGDLEFYMQGVRNILGISRTEIINENMNKLNKRYSEQYTNEQAQMRHDKG